MSYLFEKCKLCENCTLNMPNYFINCCSRTPTGKKTGAVIVGLPQERGQSVDFDSMF